jgi:thioesterase DpgC
VSVEDKVERWQDLPPLTDSLAADRTALTERVTAAEDMLGSLPPKPDRGPDQRRLAARIHDACRRWRTQFMDAHAGAVYDELSSGRTRYHRLPGLVYAAAEQFPGLVPNRAQIAAERRHIQGDKEGREIDQGIFFRALLGRPDTGDHLMDAMLMATDRARELLPAFRRTGRLDLGVVRLERDGAAAFVTARNTKCLNAEDDPLIEQMEIAIDLTLLDEQVRVGVLRGGTMTHPRYLGRRVFSAGINLTDLYHGQISFVEFLLGREIGYINKLLRGLLVDPRTDAWPDRTINKPWIAAVDSFAIGGGMQLLLVVDRVLAGADSYLSLPAAQEGIVPGAANFRLARLTGGRLARQLILGGRKLWAREPEAQPIVDEVLNPAEMDAAIAANIEMLDNSAAAANRRLINLSDEPPDRFRAYMAEFAVEQALRSYSSDVLAKLSARIGRKTPAAQP